MTRPTVVVYDQLDYLDWVYTIEEEALTAAGVRLLVPPRPEAREALPEADVVIVHDGPFSTAEFALLRDPVGIVCYSVGMDQVDADAATAAGVPVRNLPTWATQVVAEHAITLLLAAVRRLPVQDRAARTRQWDHRVSSPSSGSSCSPCRRSASSARAGSVARSRREPAPSGSRPSPMTRAPTPTSRDSPS